jgi:excisionase family DNA binding protein
LTDKSESAPIEGDVKTYSVTPAEAAHQLGINLRYVYRLIKQGKLESNGAKHGRLLSAKSLEAYRTKRLFDSAEPFDIDNQIDGQESNTRSKAAPGQHQHQEANQNQVATMALMAIQQERDRLQSRLDEVQDAWRREVSELQEAHQAKVEELQEARRLEALTIGQLTERVKNLEERLELEMDRTARETTQEAQPAVEVQIPATPVELPGVPKQAQNRPSWWSRTFGFGVRKG